MSIDLAAAADSLLNALRPPVLIYCDYIAERIARALRADVGKGPYIKQVGMVRYDLHPTEGYYLSAKKTIDVVDANGKKYRVTVEEIEQ